MNVDSVLFNNICSFERKQTFEPSSRSDYTKVTQEELTRTEQTSGQIINSIEEYLKNLPKSSPES